MSMYPCVGTQTVAAKSALIVTATTAVRPRICEVVYGNGGAVTTDSQIEVIAKRATTAGTATAVTVAGTDPNDPTATFTVGSNASAEPTYTANTVMDDVWYNPRSTYRWVAYDQRAEWIIPATAANGIGFLLNTLGGGVTVTVKAVVLQ